jgi:hypothetical protein
MTVPESHKCQGEHLLFETCKERKRNKLLYFVSLFVLQKDFFQDDLFPPTKVLCGPSYDGQPVVRRRQNSINGPMDVKPKRMDLKPNNMLETPKSFDFPPPSHHQIEAQKITTGNKYPFVCLFPSILHVV